MRFVDLNRLKIPDKWLEKAVKLQKEIDALITMEDKLAHIDKNEIWQDRSLFNAFSQVMDGKCWYSEAKELMSDRDIDHFRPKKKAKNMDDVERDGYWFLAYDWENYRFSSIYSNRLRKDKEIEKGTSKGKGIFFPLKSGTFAATNKKKIVDERPYLLDPTIKYDASLISFNSFGKVTPNVPKKFVWERERVRASVDYFHLDHSILKRARKTKWAACQRNIDKIVELCCQEERTFQDDNTIEFLQNQLIEWANEKELLSGVTIACLNKNNLSSILTI
ncbi:hypothetical protein [Chryseobacterium sp. T20]|uniref:hypothetical protein n=1 Tax=Chryseobacterium sp. T20 TaxID=3395375 RepID=UPI0039BCC6E2